MKYVLKKETNVLMTKLTGKQNYSKEIIKDYSIKEDIEIDTNDLKEPDIYFSKINPKVQRELDEMTFNISKVKDKNLVKRLKHRNRSLKYTNKNGWNDTLTREYYYAFEYKGYLLLRFKNKFKPVLEKNEDLSPQM